jgi:hypothetical protein
MARTLDEKDIAILKKCAPTYNGSSCSVSMQNFRSVLPPLAMHFSHSAEDFRERLELLSTGELEYLTDLIISGEESICCLPPEYLMALLDLITERLEKRKAQEVYFIYEAVLDCDP